MEFSDGADGVVHISMQMVRSKTFVEEEAKYLDEAFREPSRFDLQRAEFAERNPKRVLQAALQRYKNDLGKKSPIDIDPERSYTWEDVLEEARKAEDVYFAAEKGLRGVPRRVFRFLGDKEPHISPFIKFIPADGYLAPLSGGLKLIFGCARTISEKRTKIFEALADMPATMELASDRYQAYPTDQKLKKLIEELVNALVDAIDAMIEWLCAKPHKKSLQQLYKADPYSVVVDQSLSRAQKQIQSVKEYSDSIAHKYIANTATQVTQVKKEISIIRAGDIERKIQGSEMQESLRQVKVGVAGIMCQNAMNMVLLEDLMTAKWKLDCQIQQLTLHERKQKKYEAWMYENDYIPVEPSMTRNSHTIRTKDLIEILRIDVPDLQGDIEYAMYQGHDLETTCQDQCRWLLQTPQFRSWLLDSASAILFLNNEDFGDDDSMPGITSMTMLCAALFGTLQQLPQALPLHFLGGLKPSSHEPNLVVRCLITQLLLQHAQEFCTFRNVSFDARSNIFDTPALWKIFRQLLKKVSQGRAVFLLIDGILEATGGESEIQAILGQLYEAKDMLGNAPIVKVLVTMPNDGVSNSFPVQHHERLEIPECLDEDHETGESQLLIEFESPR